MKKQFLFLLLLGLLCSVGSSWAVEETISGISSLFSSYSARYVKSATPSGTTFVDKVYLVNNGSTSLVGSTPQGVKFSNGAAVFYLKQRAQVTFTFKSSSSGAEASITGYDFIINATTTTDDETPEVYRAYTKMAGAAKTSADWLNANGSELCADGETDFFTFFSTNIGMTVKSGAIKSESKVYNLFSSMSGDYAETCFSANSKNGTASTPDAAGEDSWEVVLNSGYYAFKMTTSNSIGLLSITFESLDTQAPTCTMSTVSPVAVLPSASTDLTVSADHYTSLQWYKGAKSDMSDEAVISGATATTYSYTPAVADAGKTYYFRCRALNSYSAAPTVPAVSGTVKVDVGALTCATPTITVGDFNFEHKGYTVTITNNEGSSTLKVSTDGSSYTTQTSPYVTYATTTTHYYAKAVDKTGYDDSDVAEENVTNTFDGEKKYIAWVSIEAPANTDRIYDALKSIYNVVPVVYANDYAITTSDNIKDADLILVDDKIAGGNNLAKNLKVFIGIKPMLNLKVWACTTASGRWGWGSAADLTTSTIEFDANYKFLSGVNFSEGRKVEFFTNPQAGSKQVLTLNITNAPANNQNLGTGTNGNTAMHAIIDEANLDKQYLGLGLSSENVAKYSENALTIVKNAVAMMFASERLDAVSSVFGTISAAGWSTFASSYPLDLSEVTATSGASAYYASAVNGSTVTLTPTGNVTVPAGEGLMIKGTAGETFTIDVAESGTAIDGNLLKGQTTTGNVAASPESGAGTYHYVFGYSKTDASEYGFYNLAATTSVPAGKAYLELTVEEQGAPSIIRIVDEENNATSIEALGSTEKAVKFIENGQLYILREGVVYDALGRKVR